MPGKTATLPDVDKTLKNARVELKTSPDAKNKLREAAQAVGADFDARTNLSITGLPQSNCFCPG